MEKTTTTFYIARHGETEWNVVRKLQGRLDSPLTSAGQLQAKKIAKLFAEKAIQLILTSPLGRAIETAKYCQQSLHSPLLTIDNLQERDFGHWQTRYFDELRDCREFESIFFQVTSAAPPGGESGIDCAKRIQLALQTAAESNREQQVLVITHGDAIRCFLNSFKEKGFCDAYSKYGNGQFFKVEYCHINKQFVYAADKI
ncbi:histidine phosphatase family protein [Aliikangiella sp. IMCC44653]